MKSKGHDSNDGNNHVNKEKQNSHLEDKEKNHEGATESHQGEDGNKNSN